MIKKYDIYKRYTIIFVIISIISFVSYSVVSLTTKNQDVKVVMVIDLIRHADRAPIFWSSTLMNGVWDESEIGNLTTKGREKARNYGVKISKLYPEIFHTLEIEAYTTNFARTNDTATEVLIGILGESGKDKVEIKNINKNPRFSKENKNANEVIKFIGKQNAENYPQELKENYWADLKYINKLCGTDFNGRASYIQVSDALMVSKIQKNINLCNIPDAEMSAIIERGEQVYSDNYNNNIKNFLASKDLLLDVIDTLLLKKVESITTNYKLIVMHDGNITPMLRLLAGSQGIDEGKFPDFNASIRFELIEKNNDFYVQIKYNDIPLELISKKYIYSWSEFVSILLAKILEV